MRGNGRNVSQKNQKVYWYDDKVEVSTRTNFQDHNGNLRSKFVAGWLKEIQLYNVLKSSLYVPY